MQYRGKEAEFVKNVVKGDGEYDPNVPKVVVRTAEGSAVVVEHAHITDLPQPNPAPYPNPNAPAAPSGAIYQTQGVTVLRNARPGDTGYDANNASAQLFIRLANGIEKVVARNEVTGI